MALIGYGMTHERDRCRESGMDSILTKPLQIQELIQVIKSVAPAKLTDR